MHWCMKLIVYLLIVVVKYGLERIIYIPYFIITNVKGI